MNKLKYNKNNIINVIHKRYLAHLTPKDIIPTQIKYNEKLTELRKQWAADYEAEQRRISEAKAAQVKREILQKAINLRQKNVIKSKRIEEARIRQEKIRYNYELHLARVKVVEKQKDEIRKQRFERLVDMHIAESKYWITLDNIDSLITRDLFLKPSTTGVITSVSEHWRYHCPSLSPNRTIHALLDASDHEDDDDDEISDSDYGSDDENFNEEEQQLEYENDKTILDPAYLKPIDYLEDKEEFITGEKEKIRNMLNSMIGEGYDREKYDSLVREFIDLTETLNGPMVNQGGVSKFAGEKFPRFDTLSKNDIMDLLGDPSNPVHTKLLEKETERLSKSNVSNNNSSSTMPKLFEEEDSDTELVKKLNQKIKNESNDVNANDKQSTGKYSSAESVTIEELIEELDHVDENNVNEVRKIYEKIQNHMKKNSK